MRRILSVFLLLFIINTSFAQSQKWKFGIGLHHRGVYSPNQDTVTIQDKQGEDVQLFTSRRQSVSLDTHVYLERILLESDRYQLTNSLTYLKRYTPMSSRHSSGGGVVPTTNATFLYQLRGGIKPVKNLLISAGLGLGIHFKKKNNNDVYSSNPSANELDKEAQYIHRAFSFNYHLRLGYDISRRLVLEVFLDKGIGRVDKPLHIDGSTYSLPLKWQSYGITTSYRFDLNF